MIRCQLSTPKPLTRAGSDICTFTEIIFSIISDRDAEISVINPCYSSFLHVPVNFYPDLVAGMNGSAASGYKSEFYLQFPVSGDFGNTAVAFRHVRDIIILFCIYLFNPA